MTAMEKLDGHRRMNRLSVEALCGLAGLSERTYYRRLANPDELTVGEIWRIKKALRMKAAVEV